MTRIVLVAVWALGAGMGTHDALADMAQAPAPIVIGHRGASGYRPEHTLASYEMAIDLGADFIEPDLVSTRDGVLIARHENEISATTDVAAHPEFAARRTTRTIDGTPVTGWFTEDFSLAEIKTLRARERIPAIRQRNTVYDDRYEVPTLEEVIRLVQRKERQLRRRIGLYPETKHPSYFDAMGLSLEEPLVSMLHAHGYRQRSSAVFIQSFEVGNLRQLRHHTRLRLVQLVHDSGRPYDFELNGDPRTYADLVTPAGLAEVATYADGIGVNKNLVVPRDSAGNLLPPTTLVPRAHALGLIVHAWTFRNENTFLPLSLRVAGPNGADMPAFYGKAIDEYALFYRLGVDGVFSDNPDTAREAMRRQGSVGVR
ncbi:glycerophosphodiester phosphodiesterase [Tahibacter amnicola]|uniref:glycerophosphodiester phosphodiesterase n=1 Tax=Tahibacter amnicola TaxID=2976241 RepID=A0ABY6BNZ5_9GAMM|nr:glycerophosphodiester phosphodiesterase [Tahibacter amnicola]UXI70120.1 glycerophosphodiester phosphodiesterase [Tahibacter amnicola]